MYASPGCLIVVHALPDVPLALDELCDVVSVVVEELGHGCEQEAAQYDPEAAEDEGPGADVEAEAARPHRHHPDGPASATRLLHAMEAVK